MRAPTRSLPRVVVLISGAGTNLHAIIQHQRDGRLPLHLCAVVCNRPSATGLSHAHHAKIPTRIIDHTCYSTREAFDNALQTAIDTYDPDLVVLAGFLRILTAGFVQHYHGRLLNIHPSLLPRYPGLHTHQAALDSGDQEHGATVHFVTDELDGGPRVLQARVKINPADTAQSLASRVLQCEHQIYPLVIKWFTQGRLRLSPQGVTLDGQILADVLQFDPNDPKYNY